MIDIDPKTTKAILCLSIYHTKISRHLSVSGRNTRLFAHKFIVSVFQVSGGLFYLQHHGWQFL